MRRTHVISAFAAVLASFGAAAAAAAQADRPASFADLEADPRLGERVDRVCHAAAIDDFAVATRDAVIVEAGRQGWFVLRTNVCTGMRTAPSLQIRSSGACLNEGDGVAPLDSVIPAFGRPLDPNHVTPRRINQFPACRISEIYRWSPEAAHDTL